MTNLNQDQTDQIGELLDNGQLILAIKKYREWTGAGLADAKKAIDAIRTGKSLPKPHTPSDENEQWRQDVIDLLQNGEAVKAIKLYRNNTGSGLKESKEAVEVIAKEIGIAMPPIPGCGIGILAIGIFLIAVLIWLFK